MPDQEDTQTKPRRRLSAKGELERRLREVARSDEEYERLARAFRVPRLTSRVLATIGHLETPRDLAILHERALKNFQTPDLERMRDVLLKFDEKYPGVLEDTTINLGGVNAMDATRRAAKNKKYPLPLRGIGAYGALVTSPIMNLTRRHHAQPFSDSVTVYGNHPEMLAHELGHMVDFNTRNKLNRSGYVSALMAERMTSGLSDIGPVTLGIETMANRRVREAYDDDPEQRRRIRSYLWPSYSTYLGAAGAGAHALYRHSQGKSPVTASQLGILLGAGILGRGAAGIANMIGRRRDRRAAGEEEEQTGMVTMPGMELKAAMAPLTRRLLGTL